MDWIKNLKVGDKVFVDSRLGTTLTTVERITPIGNLKLSTGRIFAPNGRERGGDKWRILSLREATPEAINEYNQKIIIQKAIRLMKETKKITISQAVEIIKLLTPTKESEEIK